MHQVVRGDYTGHMGLQIIFVFFVLFIRFKISTMNLQLFFNEGKNTHHLKTKALDPTAGYMGSNQRSICVKRSGSDSCTINDFQDCLPFSLSSIFKIHYWAADNLFRKSEIVLKPRTLRSSQQYTAQWDCQDANSGWRI